MEVTRDNPIYLISMSKKSDNWSGIMRFATPEKTREMYNWYIKSGYEVHGVFKWDGGIFIDELPKWPVTKTRMVLKEVEEYYVEEEYNFA